ncbi:hypothetical protein OAO01_09070, partial [Oligoflexia bacterium]|nr:hypothetical protein [Oligoflexia bacterium]
MIAINLSSTREANYLNRFLRLHCWSGQILFFLMLCFAEIAFPEETAAFRNIELGDKMPAFSGQLL